MMQHHDALCAQLAEQIQQPKFFNAGFRNIEVTLYQEGQEYTLGYVAFMAHMVNVTPEPTLVGWERTDRVQLRLKTDPK